MKTTLSMLAMAGLLATMAVSAHAGHHEGMMKKVESHEVLAFEFSDDDSGEPVRISLDSEETGFRLEDLAPGDSRTVTDAYGQTVTVTRGADGFQLALNGRTYDVPAPETSAMTHVHRGEVEMIHEGDRKHADMHREIRIVQGDDDGFLLISPRPLDEATEQQIRDAFAAIGLEGELRILDKEDGPGMTTMEHHKKVHVIREKIDAD